MVWQGGLCRLIGLRVAQPLYALAMMLLMTACAETQFLTHTAKKVTRDDTAPQTGLYKVGNPYQINGVWYYPAIDYEYDETGIASWYGPQFHGKATANGEIFDMNSVSAAHRTLPLPSMVRVTNLDNGRSLTLRVNDRGPFARGRVIDLSRRAAQLLGFEGQGTTKVRVQILARESELLAQSMQKGGSIKLAALDTTPAQFEVEAAPNVGVTTEELPPPAGAKVAASRVSAAPRPVAAAQSVLAENPVADVGVVTTVPVGPSTVYVQAGAFSMFDNANRVRARLSSVGTVEVSPVLINGLNMFRVRMGPVRSVADADNILNQVIDAGYPGARIVVE
jgi:rare lipoprotein A